MSKNSKKLLSLLVAVVMVLSLVPFNGLEVFAVNEDYVFDSNWNPDDHGGYEWCQACYEQGKGDDAWVEWTAFTGFAGGAVTASGHYYLTGDILEYDDSNFLMNFNTADLSICLNLNGFDISMAPSTDTMEIDTMFILQRNGDTLNIMDSKGGSVLTGVGFSGTGNKGGSVVELRRASTVNIYGGTFRTSVDYTAIGTHNTNFAGTLNIYGGDIEGVYHRVTAGTVKLVGAPTITKLYAINGATYNIDGLTRGANIQVANTTIGTVISNNSPNAAAAADWFTSADPGLTVVESNGALVLAEQQGEGTGDENPEYAFDSNWNPDAHGGYEWCQACYKQGLNAWVQWTAWVPDTPNSSGNIALNAGHHYLANDVANVDAKIPMLVGKGDNVCLNLNGKTFTAKATYGDDDAQATGVIVVQDTTSTSTHTTVNIMDSGNGAGKIIGAPHGTSAKYGCVVEARLDAVVNIYGGTIECSDAARAANNVAVGSSGYTSQKFTGEINIYGGKIDSLFVRHLDNNGDNYGAGTVTLAGAPEIDSLVVDNGALVEVGDLTTGENGAKIKVRYAGMYITKVNEGAANFAGCFSAIDQNNDGLVPPVQVKNNQLYIPGYSVTTKSGTEWYATFADALADDSEGYIGVWTKGELELTKDAYVMLMDTDIDPTVSGAHKLYAMDETQDDYKGAANEWIVETGVEIQRNVTNPVTGNRYLNVFQGEAYNEVEETEVKIGENMRSYRYELNLSAVTLRAKTDANNGMYYKSQIKMSSALANYIDTYGVVLNVNEMPNEQFRNKTGNLYTAIKYQVPAETTDMFNATVNSGAVVNVIKAGAADNADRIQQGIYANAYLLMDLDGDGDANDYVMAITDETEICNSLLDVMNKINAAWDSYKNQQKIINDFYNYWADKIDTNVWTFDNIGKNNDM